MYEFPGQRFNVRVCFLFLFFCGFPPVYARSLVIVRALDWLGKHSESRFGSRRCGRASEAEFRFAGSFHFRDWTDAMRSRSGVHEYVTYV